MNKNKNNALILIAVVVVVAGVAWFRSAREETTNTGGPTPTAPPAAGQPVPSPTTATAKEGELCPEPPPAATRAASAPTAAPTSGPTSGPIAAKLPRVVDLGADKCIPCKQLAPILEELKQEYAGRVIVEFIDVWKNPKAGEPYKISVIPTQIFFDQEGKEVWRHVGFLPKADFIAKFKELGVK